MVGANTKARKGKTKKRETKVAKESQMVIDNTNTNTNTYANTEAVSWQLSINISINNGQGTDNKTLRKYL